MITPPRIATWLLETALSTSERDAVLGDLSEEFCLYIVPTRGVSHARWWYRYQVARSLAPLFFRSWERASLARASGALVSGTAMMILPPTLLLMVRTFVLQQVPMKTTAELSLAFAALLLAVLLLTGAFGLAAAIRILNANARER